MPLSAIVDLAADRKDAQIVLPVTTRASLRLALDDIGSNAGAAAMTSAQLLDPFKYTDSKARWVRRGAGITRVKVACRYPRARTITTNPVVRVYGALPVPSSSGTLPVLPDTAPNAGILPDDGTWLALRLDGSDPNDFAGSGTTLTVAGSSADHNDSASFAWTDWSAAIDCQDAWYIIVLPETRGIFDSAAVAPVYLRGYA